MRVHERFHTGVVETVRLHHVDDVEAVLHVFACVRDGEVEPLRVTSREVVRLQDQVVFVVTAGVGVGRRQLPGASGWYGTYI